MARVLIIEDNPANMKLACLLLRHAAHSVLCAVDAETGLTLARTARPDLILMDIQLPGMDGLAATALLKQDPATAAIPVIALTAMAMKADQEKSHLAGCDAYIAKPLRYQELYAAINSLLFLGVPQAASETSASQQSPQRPSQAGVAIEASSPDGMTGIGPLILVAEDNEINQKLILRQLALLGFAANVAGNGILALERWETGNYAMVLTDLHMPEMGGYELTAAIRAQERGVRRVPIVALTANVLIGEADHCRLAGMDDYLSKPLQLSALKAALVKWLPGAAANRQVLDEVRVQGVGGNAVDVTVLKSLVGSDPAVILDFLKDFRASAKNIAMELTSACRNRQALQASQQAHKLMSSARAVGALALGDLCATMQSAGKAGNTEMLTALLPMFEQEMDAVEHFLDSVQTQPEDVRDDA